ncbi:hypothetical protein [Nocardia sp. NPDC127526]|uniref:hypothetical protein n=1 Tax=Nocardia sp. NPDC127526 TaxID=3345393 RepID=UPI00363EBEC3
MSWDAMSLALLDQVNCNNTAWASSSIENAHRAMQVHLDCLTDECPARAAARDLLERNKKLKRDSGRMG